MVRPEARMSIIERSAIRAVRDEMTGHSSVIAMVASDLQQDPFIRMLALDLGHRDDLRSATLSVGGLLIGHGIVPSLLTTGGPLRRLFRSAAAPGQRGLPELRQLV
jgi:hypothetical protein